MEFYTENFFLKKTLPDQSDHDRVIVNATAEDGPDHGAGAEPHHR